MAAKSQPSKKQQELLPPRRPTHRLYSVQGDGDRAFWNPVGAAWPNKDGKGFNLSCDMVPLTGRLVLRLITARDEIAEGGQQ